MGRGLKRVAAFAVLLFIFGIYLATDSWAADTPAAPTAAPPTVKLVNPSPLTEHLKTMRDSTYTVRFNLEVENDGDENIPYSTTGGGYEFRVVSDRNYTGTTSAPTLTPYVTPVKSGRAGPPVSLAPTTITAVPVVLTVYDPDTTSLTVILSVTSPSGVVPSTEAVTLTREPRSSNFYWIIIGSLIMGAAVILVRLLGMSLGYWFPVFNPGDYRLIYTDTTFSFSQSWLSSISAIVTAIAAVFSTTGVLTSLVPGIDTGFFLAVTVVYGITLTLAPLVYCSLQKMSNQHLYGRHLGYVLASAITAAAVGGQLSTIGAIVWLSDLSQDVRQTILVLLGAVAFLVIVYIEATRRQLWQLAPPPAGSATETAQPASTVAALP
jgi:hypothetical protein